MKVAPNDVSAREQDNADGNVRDRLERLAALGGRAAEVAHELRNALSVLETSLHLVRRALESATNVDVRVPMQIERMREQIHAGQRIVREVLEDSRDSNLDRGPTDIRALVVEAATGVEVPDDVELHVDAVAEIVSVDARQLRQLIVNLVRNAFEAVAGRGNAGAGANVWVRANVVEGWLDLDIEDDGPGISASIAPRLFHPFATDKRGGTGLGLAVCRRIVEAHHGTLEAMPRTPRGTTMRARIPTPTSGTRPLEGRDRTIK